jgi:hypothetical protein
MDDNYRFKFQIVDTETDEVVEEDWCSFDVTTITEHGDCEVVDIHVGQMMRNWRKVFHAAHQETKRSESDDES